MKVQITGASGFIGSNITKLLKAEFIPTKISNIGSYIIKEDIFIHLAGIAHNIDRNIPTKDFFNVNTDLTKKAFDAFLNSTAKKFILISSVKAITNESDVIITEDTPENPSTDYGRSKLAADNYILSKKLPCDKSLYILRPALISGPGIKGNMLRLYHFSNKRFNWVFSSISNQRSYCNISNLSFVIQNLIERNDIPSGIYLLSDNETLSTGLIVNELSTKVINNKILSSLSSRILYFILIIDKFFGYTSFFSSLRSLRSNYIICNKKITQALGEPLPFSSIEGIQSIKLFNNDL